MLNPSLLGVLFNHLHLWEANKQSATNMLAECLFINILHRCKRLHKILWSNMDLDPSCFFFPPFLVSGPFSLKAYEL